MMRKLLKLALGASMAILSSSSDVFAGHGGGRGGGAGRGGAQGGGAAMGRAPSFSQPRPAMNTAPPQGNAGAAAGGAAYANRNQTAAHPAGAAAAGAAMPTAT